MATNAVLGAECTTKSCEYPRFGNLTDDDVGKLLKDKDSKNTQRATATAVKVLRAYLAEKHLPGVFETLDYKSLDKLLAKFYTEARTEKGKLYKKATLYSLRHGLNRFLQTTDQNIDIINDSAFSGSQLAFKAMCKELKREGFGGINHHPPIEKGDLEKLYRSFDTCDPASLQEKVFVDIMLHFGRRGRENLRDLKISDFDCTSDTNGTLFIYMHKDELTKNHQLDANTATGRMYEVKGDDNCPVKSFVRYKRMLCSRCPYLFQRLSKHPRDGSYFDDAPMGHNKLGSMMTRLSAKVGLSKSYTNHSLRATTVHILDVADFANRHIMTVTGHKAETSFKTYTGYTDESTKKKMSQTISQITGASNEKLPAQPGTLPLTESSRPNVKIVSPTPTQCQSPDKLLQEFEDDSEFDNVVSSIPVSTFQPANYSTNTVFAPIQMYVPQLPAPVVTGQNAQVTINYHFFQH